MPDWWGVRMPSGATGEPPGDQVGRSTGGPHPHHIVAAVLGLAVLVALAVSGVVPDLGPGGTSAQGAVGAPATSTAPGTGATAYASPGPSSTPPGSTEPPGPLTVVGLGDSVPSADTCGCTGYVEQVGSRLQRLTQRPWVVHNDATGGWTTTDVADDLLTSPTRGHLADADLVIVQVGANDFDLGSVADRGCMPAATSDCWSATIAGLRDGLTRIIHDVRLIDTRPDLRIAVLGYWNVTLDGAVGRALGSDFVLGSDALTRLVNTTVAQVAAGTGAVYVDAYTPLKGELGDRDPTDDLLEDGDHPNATGHTLLSTAVIDGLADDGAVSAWRQLPR
ncbi:MAG: SGNH/GDSL hydrolase family protein [Terrabacter sp.]|nr:SGNH/GDSL hydrolase family protein [Dermatophilaceae bacterium]NUS41566.1 SGNH/GDSL hydrolase family protein [Terrabacter sp.]